MKLAFSSIAILLMIVTAATVITRPKLGTSLMLICMLISPYVQMASFGVRIELILIPFAFISVALHRANSFRIPPAAVFAIALWIWIFIATCWVIVEAKADSINWIGSYGYLRFLLVFLVAANCVWTEEEILRLLRFFSYAAIPFMLLSVGQTLGLDVSTKITVLAYTSPGRNSVANALDELGSILRATAVFETPAFAAVYFLSSLGISLTLLSGKYQKTLLQTGFITFAAFSSFVGGMLTLSSTFVAGFAILLGWLGLRSGLFNGSRILVALIICVAAGVPLWNGIKQSVPEVEGVIRYQYERISQFKVLESRYDEGHGRLSQAIAAIKERPIVGWGWVAYRDAFVGDSIYVQLLYSGGVIVFFLFSSAIAFAVVGARGHPLQSVLLVWLIVLIVTGAGSPSFFVPRVGEWWWALAGMLISRRTLRDYTSFNGHPHKTTVVKA